MSLPSPNVPAALTQAARRLLDSPLLTEGMEGFRETYAWRSELRSFYARTAALSVQVGPGVLRLVLPPPHPEGGRAWSGLKSSRAAALVAWVLWYHEYLGVRLGEVRQFSLAELASAVSANPEAATLDFGVLHNRRALLQAVRALEEIGALRVLDADTARWEESDWQGDAQASGGALLEFTAAAPYLISVPPPLPASAAQRAARALLCGPALTLAQDPEAFGQLACAELQELERTLNWTLEAQPEYLTLHREGVTHGLGKRWLPGSSVPSAAALLLLGAVRAEVASGTLNPDTNGRLTLSQTRLYTLLDGVRTRYRARWGEQGSEKLLAQVLDLWREWGGITENGAERGATLTLEPHLAHFQAAYEDEGQTRVARRARRQG